MSKKRLFGFNLPRPKGSSPSRGYHEGDDLWGMGSGASGGLWGPKEPQWKTGHSAGGVVINSKGKILLRQPTNFHAGYHWTFPKGGIDAKENEIAAAQREVWEETGWKCRAAAKIGKIQGGSSITVYYLMVPWKRTFRIKKGSPPKEPAPGWETQEVRWANLSEAVHLISENPPHLQLREMKALTLGYALWEKEYKRLEPYYRKWKT